MLRKLNLIPLLIIPALSAWYVLTQGIVELPWLVDRYDPELLPEVERFQITSEHTGTTYNVFVQVPHRYEESGKRYPVFYTVDGSPTVAIYNEMVLPLLRKGRMPEAVFVGVAHPVQRRSSNNPFERLLRFQAKRYVATPRIRELTLHVDERYGEDGGGHAPEYIAFLREELIPEIDARYRTIPGERGLGGFDLSGLFVLTALAEEPDLFNRYISIAPTVDWADYAIIETLRSRIEAGEPRQVYLHCSVGASDSQAYVNGWNILNDLMKLQRAPGLKVKMNSYRGRNHTGVIMPAAQDALAWVYKDYDDQ